MHPRLLDNLAKLSNCDMQIGMADIGLRIDFAGGAWLLFCYWRLVGGGPVRLCSFDEGRCYGLPSPIDTYAELSALLQGRTCCSIQLDELTGDLILHMSDGLRLQIFNLTPYEDWRISFADGSGDLSNYVLD